MGDVVRVPDDDMSPEDQALERERWSVEIERRLAEQNLEQQFLAEGRSWAELDDAGRVVIRNRGAARRESPDTE